MRKLARLFLFFALLLDLALPWTGLALTPADTCPCCKGKGMCCRRLHSGTGPKFDARPDCRGQCGFTHRTEAPSCAWAPPVREASLNLCAAESIAIAAKPFLGVSEEVWRYQRPPPFLSLGSTWV